MNDQGSFGGTATVVVSFWGSDVTPFTCTDGAAVAADVVIGDGIDRDMSATEPGACPAALVALGVGPAVVVVGGGLLAA